MPRVGVYLRLSREDEGDAPESQSIENQRRIVARYLDGQNWKAEAEYVDDGFSGMKTERPAFQRLLRDIEAGRIDTVITKDLSRLGRDYLATGEYLERYFPEHGVRYIAVGDRIDTAGAEGVGFMTPLLSVFNDLYARDISRKVRSALDSKKVAGQFIGARPPYGYQKDEQARGHLVPDRETAPVVRWMFRRYAAAGSVLGLAKELTEGGVPTPSGIGSGIWSDTTVRRILTNPTYAGHLTQNRSRKVSPKSEKRTRLPRSDWIVVAGTHAPLVTKEEFDRVQELLDRRSYRRANGRRHVLSGLVFCADCGSTMSYVREGDRTYLVCQQSRRGGRLHLCSSHCVREDAVLKALCACLRTMTSGLEPEELASRAETGEPAHRKAHQAAIEREWERCARTRCHLYQDRSEGLLGEEEYRMLHAALEREEAELERKRSALAAESSFQLTAAERLKHLQELLEFSELDFVTARLLVERVVVHADRTLELYTRFRLPEAPKGPAGTKVSGRP